METPMTMLPLPRTPATVTVNNTANTTAADDVNQPNVNTNNVLATENTATATAAATAATNANTNTKNKIIVLQLSWYPKWKRRYIIAPPYHHNHNHNDDGMMKRKTDGENNQNKNDDATGTDTDTDINSNENSMMTTTGNRIISVQDWLYHILTQDIEQEILELLLPMPAISLEAVFFGG